jgi:predicted amidohydrolase
MYLVSLQFQTTNNFQKNLDKLISLIKQTPINSFVVAFELCLSGYAYDNLDDAVLIGQKAIPILKQLSKNKTISLTLTTKKDDKIYNTLYIFHKNNIIHTQSKVMLFSLGNEEKYFTKGDIQDIKIVDIDGLKVACLICFELRFIELWQKIKGCDLIIIPSMWGKPRKEHFEILTTSLAIINQCFVCASNSTNGDMASSSGIITPFGKEYRDDDLEILTQDINLSEITKMRRYLKI